MRSVLAPLVALVLVSAPIATNSQPVVDTDERGIPTIAPLLEQVTSAVVNISVVSERPAQMNPLFRDPFFRRFFDLPDQLPSRPQMSAGSGVIVDAENGYVLTNNHVVENGDRVRVTLKDRRQFDAEIVGADPATDIAVLKIDPDDLTNIPIGDSERLKVGDFVVAVGNPFGLGQTVTSGIVSALGRSGINPEGYEDFIQTDASINPGNSGGALVTLDGKLVGINTAIISPAGGNVGIGFAVPMNMARAVMDQLVAYGEVRRGRLGVSIQNLTPDLAEALDIEATGGAVIARVQPETPAEDAGLAPGDVIVAVDGVKIDDSNDLRSRIGLTPPGTGVELSIIRGGADIKVTATLEQIEAAARPASTAIRALAGAQFETLQPGMPGHGEVAGVAVVSVAPGSAAASAGLRPGDVVTAVNNQPVPTMEELFALVDASRRVVALTIWRNGNALFLVLQS